MRRQPLTTDRRMDVIAIGVIEINNCKLKLYLMKGIYEHKGVDQFNLTCYAMEICMGQNCRFLLIKCVNDNYYERRLHPVRI